MQPQFIQLLVVLSYILIGNNADEQNGDKKPNIIIIMSDDMVCSYKRLYIRFNRRVKENAFYFYTGFQ